MKRSLTPPALCTALLLGLGARADAGPQLELSAGNEYSSLKLDDGTTSSVWYAPFSARLDLGDWTLRASIPYLSIRAPANLIVLLDDDPTGAGASNNGQVRAGPGNLDYRTVSGLGDSSLSLSYSFDHISDSPLYVDLGARVRLPTGDAHKGTGNGATDYALQSEAGLDFNRGGVAMSGGRRYLGKVDGLDRVNGWQAGSEAWLNVGPHALIGAYYDWRDASERDLNDPREAGAYASYRLTRAWKVRFDISRSLDLTKANYAVAFTIYWRLNQHRRDH